MNDPLHSGADHRDMDSAALILAETAGAAFAEGRVEDARGLFARAVTPETMDLRVLFLAFQFHFRNGELDEAERLVRRRLEVAGPGHDCEDTARAYTNLGLVLHHRGDLDGAEREMTRAVAISTRIGNARGIARDTGNLALVYESRGELERAEAMYRAALALAEEIGAEDIIATKAANLGDIARTLGRNDEARALWTRAVGLFEKTGSAKYRDEVAGKIVGLDRALPDWSAG